MIEHLLRSNPHAKASSAESVPRAAAVKLRWVGAPCKPKPCTAHDHCDWHSLLIRPGAVDLESMFSRQSHGSVYPMNDPTKSTYVM